MRYETDSTVRGATPVLAALRAALYEHGRAGRAADKPPPAIPFVTVSRQSGTGGRSFARRLADRLNAVDPGTLPWTVWDNELVEKVAAERDFPATRLPAPEGDRPSWFEQSLAALAVGDPRDQPDEVKVYTKVAITIHALAEIGRVVIVGRGGAFITRDLPGGVHLRLVAPLKDRIQLTAERLGLTAEAAAAIVREKDRDREAFYRRYWPNHPLVPESFTATFNAAAMTGDQLVACVLPLVLGGTAAAAAGRPARCASDRVARVSTQRA